VLLAIDGKCFQPGLELFLNQVTRMQHELQEWAIEKYQSETPVTDEEELHGELFNLVTHMVSHSVFKSPDEYSKYLNQLILVNSDTIFSEFQLIAQKVDVSHLSKKSACLAL